MKDSRDFAGKLLEAALRKGADKAEIYLKQGRSLSVEIKNQALDAMDSSESFGYSIRLIKNNRLGFSYSTDEKVADTVLKNALSSLEAADPDRFLALPSTTAVVEVDIFDRAIDGITKGDAIKNTCLMEESALSFNRKITKTRKSTGSFSRGSVLVMNSEGIDVSYISTSCIAHMSAVAEEGGESQIGWGFAGGRFLSDISFGATGEEAARRALQMLGARKLSTLKAPVILDNSVTAEFLGVFASSLTSESVQKGKSFLSGKTGELIISPEVTISDSGLLDRRLGSRPVDDEGVPAKSKKLIESGRLMGFLYNTYTAGKEGVSSTGNAARAGFSSLPVVGITNLYMEPASKGADISGLLTLMGKGLYITDAMGIHTANPISGEFSIGVSGLWVEDGRFQHPVKEAVISGNMLDLFRDIRALGDDLRFYGNIGAPSILVGPTDISG